MTNTLIPQQNRELAALQSFGNWMTARLSQVLATRFQHRNGNGSTYAPHIIDAATFGSWYHVVVVDPEALWHFQKTELLGQATLDAMAGAVYRPVRAFAYLPAEDGGPFKRGLVYVVTLREMPKPEPVRLPKVARLPDRSDKLSVPLGVSANGDTFVPHAKLGHALIVGATGSGKSTWVHSALASLLPHNSPGQLCIALVDPKRSEFEIWSHAPHLWGEIAHDADEAADLLKTITDEMERRGDLFRQSGYRDIATYNKAATDPVPYILVIVDECLDLVLEAGKNSRLIGCLKAIAMRGRGAGIFLWAASQHPSATDGLPRVVNVNLLTRLVFRVADADAARRAGCDQAHTIAQNTPGRMWAKLDGEPVAIQSYYLDDEALVAVAQSLAETAPGDGLSDLERELLMWALNDNSGWLTLGDIRQHTGMGDRESRRLAESLEARGLAEKDRSARNKRHVSAKVAALLAGKSDKLPN